MNEVKGNKAWLFVCFIQSERRFVVHTIAVQSFYQAVTEHKAVFPSYSAVFCLQLPVYLAEYLSRQLQVYFQDSERIYLEFARCVNTPAVSLVVTQVKSYQGLIPLTYSDVTRRFVMSIWNGEYYSNASAFVLHISLIEFFNSIFFISNNDVLNLFKNE